MNTTSIMDESRVKQMQKEKKKKKKKRKNIFIHTMIERKQTFIKFKKWGYAITVQKKKKKTLVK